MPRAPLPIRLARKGEDGEPFIDWLGAEAKSWPKRDRLTAYIQEWDLLRDEMREREPGAVPSTPEYAQRWGLSIASAHRIAAEFGEVFPSEEDPGRVVDLLW